MGIAASFSSGLRQNFGTMLKPMLERVIEMVYNLERLPEVTALVNELI